MIKLEIGSLNCYFEALI
uniref:Uncharacterized protein n=1 Tax=Rhizophora mucronata TaxID=61149 RepID=A0A2P2N3T6_RHIMU